MQYKTNCVMKKFLDSHAVNVSVLPPCVNYDLWRQPKWKAVYDRVRKKSYLKLLSPFFAEK